MCLYHIIRVLWQYPCEMNIYGTSLSILNILANKGSDQNPTKIYISPGKKKERRKRIHGQLNLVKKIYLNCLHEQLKLKKKIYTIFFFPIIYFISL